MIPSTARITLPHLAAATGTVYSVGGYLADHVTEATSFAAIASGTYYTFKIILGLYDRFRRKA